MTWAPSRAAITLPLQGYCRAGRYMPVRADGPVECRASGSIPTVVNGAAAGVVPVLIGPFVEELKITASAAGWSIPLRALRDDERLAGICDGAQPSSAYAIFPNSHVLTLPLDAAYPLPGPPAAWQALDGIELTVAAADQLDDARRSALLAGGMTLAIESPDRPDDRWPWRREGTQWILRSPQIGPDDAIVNPNVFGPISAIPPGRTANERRALAAAAVMLAGAFIAARLTRWPGRLSIFLCAAAVGGSMLWRRSLPAVVRAQGEVVVNTNDRLYRRDIWVYESGQLERATRTPWTGYTRLFVSNARELQDSDVQIVIDRSIPSFEYRARPDRCVALERSDVLYGRVTGGPPNQLPLLSLVRNLYLQPGVAIHGTLASSHWPAILLDDAR